MRLSLQAVFNMAGGGQLARSLPTSCCSADGMHKATLQRALAAGYEQQAQLRSYCVHPPKEKAGAIFHHHCKVLQKHIGDSLLKVKIWPLGYTILQFALWAEQC